MFIGPEKVEPVWAMGTAIVIGTGDVNDVAVKIQLPVMFSAVTDTEAVGVALVLHPSWNPQIAVVR